MGGGVLLAVRLSSQYSSVRILVPGTENVEVAFVGIDVNANRNKIYVCCLYIPSGSSDETYGYYGDAMASFFNFVEIGINDVVLIVGDFNFPNVEWIQGAKNDRFFLPVNVKTGIQEDIINNLLGNDFSQLNNIVNYRGRLLDLLFSNSVNDVSVIGCDVPLMSVDINHVPFEFTLDISTIDGIKHSQSTVAFNFRRADFNNLNQKRSFSTTRVKRMYA